MALFKERENNFKKEIKIEVFLLFLYILNVRKAISHDHAESVQKILRFIAVNPPFSEQRVKNIFLY
jgi:hypothetical protein